MANFYVIPVSKVNKPVKGFCPVVCNSFESACSEAWSIVIKAKELCGVKLKALVSRSLSLSNDECVFIADLYFNV